jgi:hypothetical protein
LRSRCVASTDSGGVQHTTRPAHGKIALRMS